MPFGQDQPRRNPWGPSGTGAGTMESPFGPGHAGSEGDLAWRAQDIETEERGRYERGLGSLIPAFQQSSNILNQGIDANLLFARASDAVGSRARMQMNGLRTSLGARGLNPNSGAASALLSRMDFDRQNALIGADRDILIEDRKFRQTGAAQNFANALVFLLKNTKPYLHQPSKVDRPDRYHIAGDKQVDNLELAQTIADLMGKELKYQIVDFHKTRPGHDKHYGLNDDKIRSLGWKSPVSFEESLANCIKWQSENPIWIK